MKKIALAKINDLFAAFGARGPLFLPMDRADGKTEFGAWAPGAALSRKLNAARSPKEYFFPQTERIADFRLEGKSLSVSEAPRDDRDFIVFGMRSCDARSLSVLDRVFLADPVDSFYKQRRERGTVISLSCERPGATCFCPLFGIDPGSGEADANAWIIGDWLYLEPKTEKGRAAIALGDTVFESTAAAGERADAETVEAENRRVAAIAQSLPFARLDLSRFTREKLLSVFNDPAWARLSETCLGCGACTYVCPTCMCYDIRDFDTGHGVRRSRCWDSCMNSEFTKMSAGNPRLTQVERFRQRFMHKLVYYPANNGGLFACVGCGRCLTACPSSNHIAKVIRALSASAPAAAAQEVQE
jgi:ferredoxin